MKAFFRKLFGTKNERELKRMRPIIERINSLEPEFQKLTDDDLRGLTAKFRKRLTEGETLDDILPEAFAAVREASVRSTGMRHYDVQMIGGIALHRGTISEMKTGEGKTLVATSALFLNALEPDPKNPERGMGAHLVTVNDYLAKRDSEWMGRIYNALGMSVGVIVHGLTDRERQAAYACDITYGTNNEFGFDYLRDNMKFNLGDMVHRYYDFPKKGEQVKTLHYAIVDEVDSILIDEARTPLIISGPAEESSEVYYTVNAIVPMLRRDEDYIVDEKASAVTLTESGVDKIERRLQVKNLYDGDNVELVHHVYQALKAHTLFKRDVNYVIEDNKIVIVDEFTGRKMPGRRWSDGLHQAVEAKEGLKIENENQTLATITFQNLFRMYNKLAGMTGTADTEAEEFARIYDLDVLVIPTNRPIGRKDSEDLVYKNDRAKFMAVLDQIKECYGRGQPVLVGTTSVEKSELVSRLLKNSKIPHHVLNAKNHMLEAQIIAQAGRKFAVTISTNMAGRGTDIVLGGNPEALARTQVDSIESDKFQELVQEYKPICANERQEVLAAGGLFIIGTERHESRRVDNQLRGRAGRQGDPGASQFFLSLDDDLMRIFGGDQIKNIMDRLNVPDNEPIVHKWVTRAIESAQKRVEGRNFDIRKNLLEYDDVMNQQRQTIYRLRNRVLEGSEVHSMILDAVEQTAWNLFNQFCPEGVNPEEWDFESLAREVLGSLRVKVSEEDLAAEGERAGDLLVKLLREAYDRKTELSVKKALDIRLPEPEFVTPDFDREAWLADRAELERRMIEGFRLYERERYLHAIDSHWKNHLYAMDHLKEGVHLEAYAQKDPKVIYKKEGFELFKQLLDRIDQSIAETMFRVDISGPTDVESIRRLRRSVAMHYGRGALPPEATGVNSSQRTNQMDEAGPVASSPNAGFVPRAGRNDPCPCGSGKKYKKCCLPKEMGVDPASF
ncbi:MAG TPA: preprotein translocase subunit SecA [Myxococcota bacterium]|nr:preprotein translocase subunit SecA [Myxococcota bacterium]HOC99984.1 preprotein translocase subunit SecA [Myxococcota bacterium]HOH76665.1 preprotein translocase subunit SecA [Myxococcota bacterium]